VADGELRRPFVGRGDQFQSAADQFFRYFPGQEKEEKGVGKRGRKKGSA
jgi:hypothetical protein